jgi:hypothetical protein
MNIAISWKELMAPRWPGIKQTMTRSKKVLLVIVALAVAADFLPFTREEFSWWWAQSHDRAADYARFLSDWPKGWHAADARVLFVSRNWEETKMAQIREASQPASRASLAAEAAYSRERESRREMFAWREATVSNTIDGYNQYLRQYPNGRFAAQVRRKLASLSQPAVSTGTNGP